jgi:hypothetical protein
MFEWDIFDQMYEDLAEIDVQIDIFSNNKEQVEDLKIDRNQSPN